MKCECQTFGSVLELWNRFWEDSYKICALKKKTTLPMVHLRTQEETNVESFHFALVLDSPAGMSEAAALEDDSKGVLHQNVIWNYY